jgi:hypothetical protein
MNNLPKYIEGSPVLHNAANDTLCDRETGILIVFRWFKLFFVVMGREEDPDVKEATKRGILCLVRTLVRRTLP